MRKQTTELKFDEAILICSCKRNKIPKFNCWKTSAIFLGILKVSLFCFYSKKRPGAYFIPAGDTSMRARIKKKITGHIPVLHENGEIIFSTSADDNVLLRYPSLFICYFSSLKPFLLLVYLFLGNMNSKFRLRCH